jgi:hypothetical protein
VKHRARPSTSAPPRLSANAETDGAAAGYIADTAFIVTISSKSAPAERSGDGLDECLRLVKRLATLQP